MVFWGVGRRRGKCWRYLCSSSRVLRRRSKSSGSVTEWNYEKLLCSCVLVSREVGLSEEVGIVLSERSG